MTYLGSWRIDDYLPIPVTTHKLATGEAYAPTVLTYSIYEDAGTTGIDENVNMTPASPFDSVVGFYLARRQLTTAAGFEKGKNYTVLIKATVDGVSAITSHTFQIERDVFDIAIEDTITVRQALRVLLSLSAGKVTGGGTTTITFRDMNDGTDRIVATVDSSGNRSAVVLTLTE